MLEISQEILECAAIIEIEQGRPMTAETLHMAELLRRIAADLESIGHKDAERGLLTIDRSGVEEIVSCFPDEPLRAELTDILYGAYMDGYTA